MERRRRRSRSRSRGRRLDRRIVAGGAVLLVVALALAVYFARSAMKQRERAEQRAEKIESRPVIVPASILWRDYRRDRAGARARYGGHDLIVAAKIDAVTPLAGDELLLLLRTGDRDRTMQATLRADAAALGRIGRPGSQIGLRCGGVSDTGGDPALDDCVLD